MSLFMYSWLSCFIDYAYILTVRELFCITSSKKSFIMTIHQTGSTKSYTLGTASCITNYTGKVRTTREEALF